jgi:hypothetical protein
MRLRRDNALGKVHRTLWVVVSEDIVAHMFCYFKCGREGLEREEMPAGNCGIIG